ncbi:hypothetical protein NQZ68_005971 [Dissostichus eleginoides]|nr:hypothetical protein NQZ68_005971 [Dissostichus eleginoides]
MSLRRVWYTHFTLTVTNDDIKESHRGEKRKVLAAGVEVAPYLRGAGRGQQVVLEGNRLVLTCLAGGSWPLQYRWTFNNINVTDWAPHYRLAIPSLKRTDAGLYQCMVRNRMGAVIHRKTEVQVAFLGTFSAEEQRKTVIQGRPAIISLPPLASFPRPLVTWYKDGHKIIPNNQINKLSRFGRYSQLRGLAK